jgi:carboxymethylenebutenolidase
MSRLGACLLVAALAMLAPATHAQQAAKIHMHANSGYAADGLLFEPTGNGPFAALILIHDEWGVTERIIDQAKRFANAGFVVVAIDLYRGELAADAQRAAQLSSGLSPERAQQDLEAAMTFLAGQPNVRSGHVGVIAWSVGSAAALHLAAKDPQVIAVVVNMCSPPTELSEIIGIPAVLGNFGGCDRAPAPLAITNFEKTLKARGIAVATRVYPSAKGDPSNRIRLSADDARDSQSRMLKFLETSLGERQDGRQ